MGLKFRLSCPGTRTIRINASCFSLRGKASHELYFLIEVNNLSDHFLISVLDVQDFNSLQILKGGFRNVPAQISLQSSS